MEMVLLTLITAGSGILIPSDHCTSTSGVNSVETSMAAVYVVVIYGKCEYQKKIWAVQGRCYLLRGKCASVVELGVWNLLHLC